MDEIFVMCACNANKFVDDEKSSEEKLLGVRSPLSM